MRLLVTGSRDFKDWALLFEALDGLLDQDLQVVVGDCPTGADLLAREFSEAFIGLSEVYEADWKTWGKKAGPLRNQRMIDSGVDLCYGFLQPGSENKGTRGCMRLAEAQGLKVVPFWGRFS